MIFSLHLQRKYHLIQQTGLALKGELKSDALGSHLYVELLVSALCIHLIRHYSARTYANRIALQNRVSQLLLVSRCPDVSLSSPQILFALVLLQEVWSLVTLVKIQLFDKIRLIDVYLCICWLRLVVIRGEARWT